jgi:hypothetical protein
VDASSGFSNVSAYSLPHKLTLQVRYNKASSLADASAYAASNLSVDGDVDIVDDLMLYNS